MKYDYKTFVKELEKILEGNFSVFIMKCKIKDLIRIAKYYKMVD